MKAPTDKRNDTIQICVTWACDRFTCSNCTQLLPFRCDEIHMHPDCFRRAVSSVRDWPGVVGMFGGNPCVHPMFETLCDILAEEIPEQRRRGLWSNNLLGHGETVRRTFYPHGRFNLNAHGDAAAAEEIERELPGKLIPHSSAKQSMHSAILVDWRDMGIPPDTWHALREACDINLNWSAGIREVDGDPYVYFCEVAAALDGIRGVNYGIPAEPGWWRWDISRFAQQVANCCNAGCGVPLRIEGSSDVADQYDMSTRWNEALEHHHGRIHRRILETAPVGSCPEATDYMRRRSRPCRG
uniref:Uncharacterized protein n=1 Tax=viral metagenome TaxID=1070528 RepID=A0A6M3IQM2_9ZZZZ